MSVAEQGHPTFGGAKNINSQFGARLAAGMELAE